MTKSALLIVDVQNDFCPGGSLVVPEGDKVIPVLNEYIDYFSRYKFPIFASRDWHPSETKHFKKFGGNWPVHCVQRSKGAKFHPDLKLPKGAIVISKGLDPSQDSYSAFQAEDKKRRAFQAILDFLAVKELYVGGLAADYCVKASVLDALTRGFKVKLLIDAIRGVNRDSSQKAIEEMIAIGAKKMKFTRLK